MSTLPKEELVIEGQSKFMTEEEFLQFCDEDIRAEFMDGEVIVHSPVSIKHNQISMFLGSIIQFYVDKNNLGRFIGDNFQVKLRPGLRRVPDLVFVAKDNEVTLTSTEVEGPPDLVVEIVSPDSVDRDWRDKYLEYQKAKVKEYWIIDPNTERCEIYCLNQQGKYEAQESKKGLLSSRVLPNFWINPNWLWQDPLPNVLSIAKELKIQI